MHAPALPPGLRELAQAENLTDANIKQLADAYDTIRGGRPRTLEQWQQFYAAVKLYLREDYGESERNTEV